MRRKVLVADGLSVVGACICLSWGNSACCDWELCLFTLPSGMCVCVWCVSWYQHYQVGFIVAVASCDLAGILVCPVCQDHVCVKSVSVWAAHDFSQMESLPFAFQPITASGWPHTLPESSAHSPLLKTLKATLSLPPSFPCPRPPVFLPSPASLFFPAVNRKSIQNLFNSTWLCTHLDVRMCACLCTHRETNMKQMFR